MNNVVEQYTELSNKIRELTKQRFVLVKDIVACIFTEIFTKYPELDNFSWKQWHMGFNDGEPTYFQIGYDIDNLSINGIEGYDENNTNNDLIRNEISSKLKLLDREDLKDTFEENTEVTVYRDGKIETSSYECGY